MSHLKNTLPEKVQDALFDRILSRAENKQCVDCPTKSPRWTSMTYGCFICMRCAGHHRNLGYHITRVKSVKLDTW